MISLAVVVPCIIKRDRADQVVVAGDPDSVMPSHAWASVAQPTNALMDVVDGLVAALSGARGGAIQDARIVATCLDHNVRKLCSADRDFSKFPGLRVRNPLVA
jgi:predicted nucleic acid-binding protein